MPHIVHTNGAIHPFGDDVMKLFDAVTGDLVGAATRTAQGHWLIHVDGVDDVTADTRGDAIVALQTQAMTALDIDPETGGYSAIHPTGLQDMP